MIPASTTTITMFRMVITMTVDESRASRFTSVTMREASSAEWRPEKNDSGIRWRWV